MNLPIMVEKLLEVTRMPRSANKITLLVLSSIAVLLILSVVIIPSSATKNIQLQPTTVDSGDRLLRLIFFDEADKHIRVRIVQIGLELWGIYDINFIRAAAGQFFYF